MMKQQTVETPFRVGVFDTVAQADRAVHRLLDAGFTKEQLAIICSDKHKEHLFQQEHLRTEVPSGSRYTPGAVPAGAAIGATIGGIALAATAIATGGAGLLAADTVLVGGGALAGSFTGAMMTRAAERETSLYYAQAVEFGKILVAVEVHGPGSEARLVEAERILAEAGTEPVPLVEG
jgi:hypothetical protein